MTQDEFKIFWDELIDLYPFSFKGESVIRQWATAMKDATLETAQRAIRGRHKSDMMANIKTLPTPEAIAESAIRYSGASKLIWQAVQRNKKLDGDNNATL